jgi:hypothetical protein
LTQLKKQAVKIVLPERFAFSYAGAFHGEIKLVFSILRHFQFEGIEPADYWS